MIYLLALISILTSIVSGVTGMAGGVLLLSAMSFFLPYHLLIPIHGIVQFISNSSRAFYLKKHIRFDFLAPYFIGAPIGIFIAYKILTKLENPSFYYLFLALFIIYSVFKPKRIPEIRLNKIGWFILGIVASIQSSLLGATGPLLAIFYMREDISKEEIVANKAFQQLGSHLLKIPLFLSMSFNYFEYSALIILMCLGATIGTYVGVNFLKKLDDKKFKLIFKFFLLIAAMRLFYKFWIEL